MKKHLTLLLSALLLLNFAACGKTIENESSTPQDESVQTDVSDEPSESSEPEKEGEMNYTLISVGKPYTSGFKANENYADRYEQQLTDGFKTPDFGVFYTDPRMSGYTSTNKFIIDLGEDGKRINRISVRSLDVSQDGVLLSSGARFYGSADNSKWKFLGSGIFSHTGDRTVSTATLDLEEPVDYQYIRVETIIAAGSAFYFLDEIEIYADVPEKSVVSTLDASYKTQDFTSDVWKKLSTGKQASPKESVNIARGAAYSYQNAKFDSRTADAESKLLTDGANTSRLFGENVWVGIQAAASPSITVTLNEKHSDIYAFKVYALNNAPNVRLADYIDVYASDNNKDYTLVGRMYATDHGDNHTYTLLLPEYIAAKYIRFAMSAGSTDDYYWLEEVEIIAGTDDVSGELYPPIFMDKPKEEVFWPATDSDYNENKNLILGLPQKIASSDYRDITIYGNETGPDTTLLTDGKLASTTYCYNGEYFFTRGGAALEFFYDIGAISTIREFHISYLEHVEYGIHNPRWVTIFLSEDSENWYPVSYYTGSGKKAAQSATRKTLDWVLETPYAARYVRFRIESAFLFADELEVTGTKAVDSQTVRISESGITPTPYYLSEENRAFASTENTPIKDKDIVLVYGHLCDESTLLPMVAYLDSDGNIKDTLMDGFLYCLSGTTPSGALGHLPNTKADWEYIYDITFNGKGGLDALEKTVGKVKSALNKPDYRVSVYFTMLSLHKTVTDFGDVDGDGVTESLATAEGRKKVIDWYIKLCRDDFNARGYQNLKIGGFYWIDESVMYGESDDSDIIKEVSDCVHQNGEYLLWIPYFNANRYFLTYELGFDLICMQPNYMFSDDKPLSNFTHTAEVGMRRKMCVEIEHSYQAFSDPKYARKYMLYLYYGATTGYMKDAIHIYYDDLYNFSTLAYSDDPLCRMQYDATYEFVRGTLDITPEKRDTLNLTSAKNEITHATLARDGELACYTIASAPAHGTVTLSPSGDFLYFPDPDYTGSDSFTYTYNNYLGESEPYTVSITVK